jgi:outer membrane scaffolding protein for murein synthesis (MipA/OmpV family)
MRHSPSVVCLLILAALCASPARAGMPLGEWQYSAGQSLLPYFTDETPRWQRLASAGVVALPRYEGASAYRAMPSVTLEARYQDLWYASTAEGLGVNLLRGRGYRAGTSLGFDLGRDADVDHRLRGLDDLDPAAEAKLYGEVVLFPVVLRADARRILDGRAGWSADFSAYLPVAGNPHYFVFVGPSVTWSDAQAMERDFGVRPEEAARSVFSAYRPSAGVRSASFGANATAFFRDDWFVNATGGVTRLLGPAAASPLAASREQYLLTVMVGYRW